jgi:predicted GTPase
MAAKPHSERKQEEGSDLDEETFDDVEVKIAIFGKAGSGRSSFANTILGYGMHAITY